MNSTSERNSVLAPLNFDLDQAEAVEMGAKWILQRLSALQPCPYACGRHGHHTVNSMVLIVVTKLACLFRHASALESTQSLGSRKANRGQDYPSPSSAKTSELGNIPAAHNQRL
jgi:hypothetical protein